jgi:hypothetical protein
VWRQFAIKGSTYWYDQYVRAAKSSVQHWTFGFRLEDLEEKLEYNFDKWTSLRKVVDSVAVNLKFDAQSLRSNNEHIDFQHNRQVAVAIYDFEYDDDSVYQILCGTNKDPLQIGINDFRTDKRDVCQVFAGLSDDLLSPQNMFQLIPLEGDLNTSYAFAIRSIANGNFVKTVPPPQDNTLLPWKLVVGGPSIGAAERFRVTPEGYLYSGLLRGFFQCGGGDMVKGYPGVYGSFGVFTLRRIRDKTVHAARELVHLSDQIKEMQNEYTELHRASEKERKVATEKVLGSDNPSTVKICMAVPMTSKGTEMNSISESPFWVNLFDSFMRSIDWRSNRYEFKFYLGFDKGDSMYDVGDSWSEFRDIFHSRAGYRMTEQLMDPDDIDFVLKKQLHLKLMDFAHLEGAPTQVVSQLTLAAHADGFDYFYQINDDTVILSPNWAPKMISNLASNPSIPNFGLTGPLDTNNEKIFTHAFVHRTHIEVYCELRYYSDTHKHHKVMNVYAFQCGILFIFMCS